MKGKHTGGGSGHQQGQGQGQGYPPRTYQQYQAAADNGRQYSREPPFHIQGGPGAGQGMRQMHHQHPQQPPTPPQPQQQQQLDPKAPPVHMQAMMQGQHQQQHQQPQPGSQMMYPGHMMQGRPATPQQLYNRSNAPVSTRPPAPRMLLQGPQFIPANQQVPYAGQVGMGQSFMVPYNMPPNRYAYMPNAQYTNQYPGVVYTMPVRQAMVMQQPTQPGAVAANMMVPPSEQAMAPKPQRKPRTNAVSIIDPTDGHNVLEAYFKEENTPPGSGESSARETPQLVDNKVTAEFARKVASTLGDDAVRPGSRSSSYSESEPHVTHEHNAPREGKWRASPKIDAEVVMMGEPSLPMVENNVGYAAAMQEPVVPAWVPHMAGMAIPPPPIVMLHHQEDVMRPPPHRDFQSWPPQEPAMVASHPAGMPMPMPLPTAVPTAAPPSLPPQPTLLKKPEQTTPVVSALSGPEMDNINREYPTLSQQRHATHQSPGRSKRPQRPPRQEPEPAAPAPAPVPAPQHIPQPVPVSAPVAPVSMSVPPPSSDTPKVPSPAPVEPSAPLEPVSQPPPVQAVDVSQPAPQPIRIEQPPAPLPEAKSGHQKNKSNKRQRQEQQRQATPPPPPRAASPPPQPAVEPPAHPAKQVQVTQMAPQRVASPARAKQPSPSPPPVVAPTPVAVAAPRQPTPPPPVPVPVAPVVDTQASLKQNEVSDELREERLVAAMNEENDKMTASVKRAETAVPAFKPAAAPAPAAEAEPVAVESDIAENNNVAKVIVQVEAPPQPAPVNEVPAKIARKVEYKKEQWSPENPTGKKQYDRDFIMQLMHETLSKKRPENLPALEVLRDAARRENVPRGGSMHNNHIPMPGYMNKSSSLRGSGSASGPGGPRDNNHMKRSSMGMGKQDGGGRMGGMGGMGGKPGLGKPMPIQVTLSLHEEVKLRECETPWKPARNTSGNAPDMTEEDKKTEALYKKVRGVLNRLTPQKFHKLVAQVRAMPIDTPERLEGVINLVFEKAVDEPGFSSSYAEMCKELGKLTVKDSKDKNENDKNEKKPNYRALLVQRCQKEFEKNNSAELNRDERLKEIEAEPTPEKRKEMTALLDEDERKIRVKSVGNIRFIGELYKLQQLTSFIMFACIDHLIRLNSEESLECLCKLLSTIGINLESDYQRIRENLCQKIADAKAAKDHTEAMKHQQQLNSMPDFNKYFDELDKISRGKTKSSRVRFMIKDLIDLRLAKWKPKRDEGPKTMDQIAKEAEREQLETNLAISAANMDNRRGGGGRQDSRNSMDNRGGGGGGGGGRRGQESNGGWTQVSTASRKQYVETSKLRVTNVEMDLGMSLGSRDAFIWNKGSANKSEERKPQVTGFNKFAVLDEKPISRTSSLKGTLPTGPAEPRDVRDVRDVRDMRPLRPSPPDERSSRSSTPSLRADAAPVSRDSPVEAPPTPVSAKVTDPEQFERSVHNLCDEFIHNGFFEEAVKTLLEKVDDSMKSEMVLHVFLYALEKAAKFRRGVGRMLAHFLHTGNLTIAQLFSGLKSFLADADDLVVDIPKLWEYLGEIVADVVSGGMGIVPVLDALRPPTPGAARAIAAILRIVAPLPGVTSCLSPLTPYLGGPQAYQTFLAAHQLEGLEKPAPVRPVDEPAVAAELTRLLRANAVFDVVTKWIDFNVGPACADVAFIRVLTNALLDVCLTPNASSGHKLDQDVFKRHVKLLTRYIDFNEERELHCLFTIQAKMSALDHPQGVLSELCNQLLEGFAECYVISSEAFKKWRDNTDPQYMVGRGVCIKSLHTFFTVMDADAGDDTEDVEETS